jgi:molecular chaperone DnaK
MREAESHADEDRKQKEAVETRNQAEQSAYAAERLLADAGDKLSAADRQPIESAIETVKKAIERNDVAEIKRAMDALNSAQHKAAEAMYRSASGAGAGQPGGAGPNEPGPQAPGGGRSQSGDVIDAEVVEEEKR